MVNEWTLDPNNEGGKWYIEVNRKGTWQNILVVGDGQGWERFRVRKVK